MHRDEHPDGLHTLAVILLAVLAISMGVGLGHIAMRPGPSAPAPVQAAQP